MPELADKTEEAKTLARKAVEYEDLSAARAAGALYDLMSSATFGPERVFTLKQPPIKRPGSPYSSAVRAIIRLHSDGAITDEQRDVLIAYITEDRLSDRISKAFRQPVEAV